MFPSFLSPHLAAVSVGAEGLFGPGDSVLGVVTNSVFVALITMGLIVFAVRRATAKMSIIPGTEQNAVEAVVEALYGQVEGIVGKHVAPRAFPLLATMFLFILVSNWFALVPGVGTVGFAASAEDMAGPLTIDPKSQFVPLLRPATADLNMTLAIAACAMVLWLLLTLREVGLMGFLKHTFGPKGGMTGFIGFVLAVVFFLVGIIELVSIAFRPVSLSLRLYGNVFAGENLLHTMLMLGDNLKLGQPFHFLSSVVFPLPFYFLEILVGLLQAVVFTLLAGVYIRLTTSHDDEH
jgi:F-type H+-transporting ATPase subunit a